MLFILEIMKDVGISKAWVGGTDKEREDNWVWYGQFSTEITLPHFPFTNNTFRNWQKGKMHAILYRYSNVQ